MKNVTIAAPFVEQALLGAKAAGYDTKAILTKCGVAPILLREPLGRIPLSTFVRIIQYLIQLMDDECIGLLAGMRQPRGSFEMMTRALFHETELDDATNLYVRYANLINPGIIHSLERNGDIAIYTFRRSSDLRPLSHYVLEAAVMTAHRFFCWLGRKRINIAAIEFDYPKPLWSDEHRHLAYGAPVRFNQPAIRMFMHRSDLSGHVAQDLNALKRFIERAPRDIFTPIQAPDISHQTREHILRELRTKSKLPTASETAAALGFTPQTFWRRLQAEEADYTTLRIQARRDRAIWLLSMERLSIEQIAEAVDYADSSAFVRAFKSWTGLTPMAYRRGASSEPHTGGHEAGA